MCYAFSTPISAVHKTQIQFRHVALTIQGRKNICLDNNQLDTHLLYFKKTSITFLYMFQALNAHHQEANCIDTASGIVLSVSGRSVHMFSSLSTCAQGSHLLRGQYQMLHQYI